MCQVLPMCWPLKDYRELEACVGAARQTGQNQGRQRLPSVECRPRCPGRLPTWFEGIIQTYIHSINMSWVSTSCQVTVNAGYME